MNVRSTRQALKEANARGAPNFPANTPPCSLPARPNTPTALARPDRARPPCGCSSTGGGWRRTRVGMWWGMRFAGSAVSVAVPVALTLLF